MNWQKILLIALTAVPAQLSGTPEQIMQQAYNTAFAAYIAQEQHLWDEAANLYTQEAMLWSTAANQINQTRDPDKKQHYLAQAGVARTRAAIMKEPMARAREAQARAFEARAIQRATAGEWKKAQQCCFEQDRLWEEAAHFFWQAKNRWENFFCQTKINQPHPPASHRSFLNSEITKDSTRLVPKEIWALIEQFCAHKNLTVREVARTFGRDPGKLTVLRYLIFNYKPKTIPELIRLIEKLSMQPSPELLTPLVTLWLKSNPAA